MMGHQEAEECTQEVFIRAWEKLDGFRGESAFSSWLHRLAVNVVLGRFRDDRLEHGRVVAVVLPQITEGIAQVRPPLRGSHQAGLN